MDGLELKSYANKGYELKPNGEMTFDHEQTLPEGVEVEQAVREEEAVDAKSRPEGCLDSLQWAFGNMLRRHPVAVSRTIRVVLLLLYFAYFSYAMYYKFGDEGSLRLLVCTCFGVCLIVYSLLSRVVSVPWPPICLTATNARAKLARKIVYWALCLGMAAFVIIYTIVEVGLRQPRNLVSLSGIAFFLVVLFLTSTNIAKVQWHPVFWGMVLQYVFALIIIRTSWGYDAFDYLGDRITELLSYARAGASFLFGEQLSGLFAFGVLPVIIYVSSLVSILYYLGVMQVLIRVIGRFLAFCLHTSPTESINTAANIFLSQNESPLLIRPFLSDMTKSELHAVLTGGFATVSGSVLGAYISFGVKASYLIGASVMSAPAALAISKLTFPETETSRVDQAKVFKMAVGGTRNMIEAAVEGASVAISLAANVAANLVAFLSILAFVDATLVWFGDRVGIEGLTFQLICSYLFYPMAYLMGVDAVDCRRVAQLIGYKTFANEFVAYIKMGDLLTNLAVYQNYTKIYGVNATVEDGNNLDIVLSHWNQTLPGGFLSRRSEVITTYALCGFSNIGSMGIMLGVLGGMAPSRRSDLAKMVFRALVAGSVACFVTACIAGLFFEER